MNQAIDPKEEFPGVERDEFRRHLLEKVEGVSFKVDGIVESRDLFSVGHVLLDKEQEAALFYFLMDNPEVKLEFDISLDGYSAGYRLTRATFPYRLNLNEAFLDSLEEAIIVQGVLYKSSRDINTAMVSFAE